MKYLSDSTCYLNDYPILEINELKDFYEFIIKDSDRIKDIKRFLYDSIEDSKLVFRNALGSVNSFSIKINLLKSLSEDHAYLLYTSIDELDIPKVFKDCDETDDFICDYIYKFATDDGILKELLICEFKEFNHDWKSNSRAINLANLIINTDNYYHERFFHEENEDTIYNMFESFILDSISNKKYVNLK